MVRARANIGRFFYRSENYRTFEQLCRKKYFCGVSSEERSQVFFVLEGQQGKVVGE